MAGEIYRLWIKSVATDSTKKFKHIFASSLGKEERKLLTDPRYYETAVANFDEAFRTQTNGTVKDLIYALSPHPHDLTKIETPIDIWIGSDDTMITDPLIDVVYKKLKNKNIHKPDGYGSDLNVSLFEDILSTMQGQKPAD
jgi:hypothetical protein